MGPPHGSCPLCPGGRWTDRQFYGGSRDSRFYFHTLVMLRQTDKYGQTKAKTKVNAKKCQRQKTWTGKGASTTTLFN